MATIHTHSPMVPQPFCVQHVRQETSDTFTMMLESVNENSEFHFEPGQFNMLYVFGVGEIPISISGDPRNTKTIVHTTRAVGSVTKALRNLKQGDIVGIRGPFGTHWPVESVQGSDIVVVAGGIGLPPLRPALYHVLAHREKYGKVVLLYGTRTPQDILFRKELEKWRARFDMDVFVTVDRALRPWRGYVGVVTSFISRASFDPPNAAAMVVGPEIMMRYAVLELLKRGVPSNNVYISMERNMKCAIGLCGHCQLGPEFICKDGPVFSYDKMKDWMSKWEV